MATLAKSVEFSIHLSRPMGARTKEYRADTEIGGIPFCAEGSNSGEAVAKLLADIFRPMALSVMNGSVHVTIRS